MFVIIEMSDMEKPCSPPPFDDDSSTLPSGHLQLKRKAEDMSPNSPPSTSKRICIEQDSNDHLSALSEDVLLLILSKLDNHSLLNLGRTCTLFERLCLDYSLWRRVNVLNPILQSDLKTIVQAIHTETTKIKIVGACGQRPTHDILTVEFLETVKEKCPDIDEFSVPYNSIDCNIIGIVNFPSTLTILDLSHSTLRNIPQERSYFRDICFHIPNLKTLILSHCSWFEPHSLMAISKLDFLENLYLNDCFRVRDCLAYCGLSTRSGFKSLKTLDLRRCAISNSELICFSSVATLKNLYLESCRDCFVYLDSAVFVLCTSGNQPLGAARVRLERLAVRYYTLLHDETVLKLAVEAENLKYLDITGCTKVTEETVAKYKRLRPDVTIETDLDV